MPVIDERIKEWATERQREYIEAVNLHGSNQKAAVALGLNRRTVDQGISAAKAAAARAGYAPDHDMTHIVPDGFRVKGVSTYYNKEGKPSGQWVKSAIDHERQQELMRAAFEALAEELPRVATKPIVTSDYLPALMAVYPIGDAHIGMLADPRETQGPAWDLEIAERVQCGAMAALVELAPAAERAVIINLGDWYHADNLEGRTARSGHHLSMDGNYASMIRVGMKVMRQCIESALAKHRIVRVINVIGNHDDTGAMWLSVALKHMYANEPRVEIDDSPAAFMYFQHGKVLVGCHHGHSCKADALPGVMAADRAKEWGETKHRYWYIGHVHHQSVKEYAGVSVESFNTLASRDAWTSGGGYRSRQNMKCIVLHSEHGEVCRHTVSPEMLRDAA